MPIHRGTCPLCLAEGWLEQEHIIPRWMERIADAAGAPGNTWTMNLYRGDQLSHTREPTDHYDVTMPLCRPCNKRLGKRFEEPAAPILKQLLAGQHGRLSPKEQRAVSRWMVKTAVLVGGAHGLRMYPPFHDWLRACGPRDSPPPGTRVWVGKNIPTRGEPPRIEPGSLPPVVCGPSWHSVLHVAQLALLVLHQAEPGERLSTPAAEERNFIARVCPERGETIDVSSVNPATGDDFFQIDATFVVV